MNPLRKLAADLSEFLKYKDLAWLLARRELVSRYKRSILGVFWTLLNPIIATIVYSIVFSSILKFPVDDFIIFFLAGYFVWNFFAQSTSAASVCIVGSAPFFRKHYVPKTVFVISVIVSALINFIVSIPSLVLVMFLTGKALRPVILLLPFLFIPSVAFSLGLSFLLSSLTVLFSDVKEIYQAVLTPWFFLTPIVYPLDIIPTHFLPIVHANPMVYIVGCFREPIYNGQLPQVSEICIAMCSGLVSMILGYYVFSKLSDRFIYHV